MRTPLDLTPGLISDDTKTAAEGAWSDIDKARFWRGRPQTIGGWESFAGAALTGVCRTVFAWTDNSNVLNAAFGTNSKLQVYMGGGLYDITPTVGFVAGNVDGTGGTGWGTGLYSTGLFSAPSSTDYFPLTWSLSTYGQNLVACARNQGIYQWTNNTATPAALVVNAPTQNTCALVTPQRQIVAFGTVKAAGGFDPLTIRGCDIENPTSWTVASSNNAFETHLEGGGRIVMAKVVGNGLFVWTDSALWMGQFIGDPGQTWRFTRVGDHCGLIGPNACVVVGQVAYWMSPDINFFSCAYGGVPQLMVSPIRKDVVNNLAASQQDKIVATSVVPYSEVWWFYPDARDGVENSRYVSTSLVNPLWMRGTLARTAFVDAGPAPSPIGVDPSGNSYYHERGNSADGSAFSWYAETAAQFIDNGERLMTLKGLWPDFQDQVGAVNLTIYTRLYPQSADRTRGPYALSPGKTKRDFLVTGRMVRVRLGGSGAPTYARFGKLEFEVEEAGAQ